MLTYVINLECQPARMARMAGQLAGVPFERVPAVEGRLLDGPECRAPESPGRALELTRYELALIASHKEVWRRFLASGETWCCVLEDDVILSPDFPDFMRSADWLPAGASIVKIESFGRRKLFLGAKEFVARDRSLRPLLSTHLGTAGYVLERKAAAILQDRTSEVSSPIDNLLFEDLLGDKTLKIYQMAPALCIQELQLPNAGVPSGEFKSTIQAANRKPSVALHKKLLREVKRPFVSFANAIDFVLSGRFAEGKFRNVGFR